MIKQKLTKEEEFLAVELYKIGNGLSTVALKLSCSHGIVRRLIEKEGIMRTQKNGLKIANQRQSEAIRENHKESRKAAMSL